ncbi:aminoglycoside 3'-phosphotransferase [Yinghuangia seranimata]|uniref:aminoglycoside 3'-phosphotransferase n=1 Tax=Yinghuangia seranimata TaxID=408067 RepID=UPI00248B7C02|nr:aminoglycoside 3'-phosphotransferase [Yinghuangia seranimata]MDI2124861.1 aminoglycoside 3'-phosphotransferase [Yinghuangia seranimata]
MTHADTPVPSEPRVVPEIPTGPVPVPGVVGALAGGFPLTPVWVNELGGLTFRLDAAPGDVRYVKWVAAGTPEIDLPGEAARLAWASRWIPVPEVVEHGSDADGAWLVTRAVPGVTAVDPRWCADAATITTAVAGIGRGLRLLHDALPVEDCPFEWSVAQRLARADERIEDGEGPADWSPEHRHLTVAGARALIDTPPPIDRLVVCHGDTCVPNTMLHADGSFAAHVDLGSLGVADRWADLAVAAWSLDWNYGTGYDHVLYDAYGIAPDAERIAYYRLLWDLG